jgi:hypothetical protein
MQLSIYRPEVRPRVTEGGAILALIAGVIEYASFSRSVTNPMYRTEDLQLQPQTVYRGYLGFGIDTDPAMLFIRPSKTGLRYGITPLYAETADTGELCIYFTLTCVLPLPCSSDLFEIRTTDPRALQLSEHNAPLRAPGFQPAEETRIVRGAAPPAAAPARTTKDDTVQRGNAWLNGEDTKGGHSVPDAAGPATLKPVDTVQL